MSEALNLSARTRDRVIRLLRGTTLSSEDVIEIVNVVILCMSPLDQTMIRERLKRMER